MIGGFHLQADPSHDEATAPVAQGQRKWLPFRDTSSLQSLMHSWVGPVTQAVLALRVRDLRWGIVTDGAGWRLVDARSLRRYVIPPGQDGSTGSPHSLDTLARSKDPASLRLFHTFCHRFAFDQ